jgi:outer membrane receptor for monomeric catechols
MMRGRGRSTIADIAGESTAQPLNSIKIASLTASGVGPEPTRGSAEIVEAADMEISFVVAQSARSQNVRRDAARMAVLEAIKTGGEKAAAANPDARAAGEAIASFVDTPQQTLVIKLTPVGKLPALQLLQLLKTDPLLALAQFKVEASTGP